MNETAFDLAITEARTKLAVGAASSRLAKLIAARHKLLNPASGLAADTRQMAKELGKAKSDVGYLRQRSLANLAATGKLKSPLLSGNSLAIDGSTVDRLFSAVNTDLKQVARKREIKLSNRLYHKLLWGKVRKGESIYAAGDQMDAAGGISSYMDRIKQKAVNYAKRHRTKLDNQGFTRERAKRILPVENSIRSLAYPPPRQSIPTVAGLPTGNGLRFKGFDAEFIDTAKGRPIWQSPHADVADTYVQKREFPAAIGVTDVNTLQKFGPLGPTTQHMGEDSRNFGWWQTWKSRRKPNQFGSSPMDERPDYEQVGTMPDFSAWVAGNRFYRRQGDQYAPISARGMFGKDFGSVNK